MIVYISIGNSDDRLSQAEWSEFWQQTNLAIRFQSVNLGKPIIHGSWVSEPTSRWQNACWCVELNEALAVRLRRNLRLIAGEASQDSIAWAQAHDTEFLTPITRSDTDG